MSTNETKPWVRRTTYPSARTGAALLAVVFVVVSSLHDSTTTTRVYGFSTRPSAATVRVRPATPGISRTTRSLTGPWANAPIDDNDNDPPPTVANTNAVSKPSTDPTPVLARYWSWQTPRQAASFAAVAALAMSLVLTPLPSFAAMSGGRMGGSFAAPPVRSSAGSLSGGGHRSGYSRGFGSGYGAGYYSRGPSVMVSPFFNVNPFYTPGYYYGGAGVMGYRGPGLLSFLLLGGLLFAATSAMSNAGRSLTTSWDSTDSDLGRFSNTNSALGPGNSVVQLSVAMDVSNRDDSHSILGALGRLSRTARTDSRVGIQNLTSQVALEVLRRKSSIVSASSHYQHYKDRTKALREFNNRSVRERGKFERETVSQYGGVEYGQGASSSSNKATAMDENGKATMAVVTLLLTIDGDSTKVPTIRSMGDVEDALRKIAADAKVGDCLQGAEILWTPEDRSETLSPRDVIADYPELRSI